MQQVSIQHAVTGALAGYLQTQLRTEPDLAAMTVNDRWPDLKVLPPRTATVLLAGEMEKEQCDKLIALKTPIPGVTNKQIYTIQQFQCRQPLQIDLWATSHPVLDDLVARIDDLLNMGTSTLPGSFNNDTFGEGVTLLLGSKELGGSQQKQWQGTVAFLFESFVGMDTPDARQRSEYRATARGFADFCYTSDRIVNRLFGPTLRLRVHEIGPVGQAPPVPAAADLYTVISGGKGFVWALSSPPTITTVGPASGPLSGGTVVTIVGTGFTSGATVLFGSSAGTSVTVVSATVIKATTPLSLGPGVVPVIVTLPDGEAAVLPQGFTYQITSQTVTAAVVPGGTTYQVLATDDLVEFDESNGLLAQAKLPSVPLIGEKHGFKWQKWTLTAPPPVILGNGNLLEPFVQGTQTSGATAASTTLASQESTVQYEWDGTSWVIVGVS